MIFSWADWVLEAKKRFIRIRLFSYLLVDCWSLQIIVSPWSPTCLLQTLKTCIDQTQNKVVFVISLLMKSLASRSEMTFDISHVHVWCKKYESRFRSPPVFQYYVWDQTVRWIDWRWGPSTVSLLEILLNSDKLVFLLLFSSLKFWS